MDAIAFAGLDGHEPSSSIAEARFVADRVDPAWGTDTDHSRQSCENWKGGACSSGLLVSIQPSIYHLCGVTRFPWGKISAVNSIGPSGSTSEPGGQGTKIITFFGFPEVVSGEIFMNPCRLVKHIVSL